MPPLMKQFILVVLAFGVVFFIPLIKTNIGVVIGNIGQKLAKLCFSGGFFRQVDVQITAAPKIFSNRQINHFPGSFARVVKIAF